LREGHGSPWSEVHCDPRRLRSLTPGSSDPLEGESLTGILEQVLSEIRLQQLVHDQAQLPDE
jgi:hypothetical protein